MFVDELEIYAQAGTGGDGVVRWRQEKFKPKGGPAGGNGGKGGDVYIRAVRNLNILSKYTGDKKFRAKDGEPGRGNSQFGKGSNDLYIDIPVGSVVTDLSRERTYELTTEGEVILILHGGRGGLGNEYFKSSTNQAPLSATKGKEGETGNFLIEVSLVVDVGLVGLPNAGKSTLLNALTNAKSPVGAYQFTTLEPHLGSLYEFIVADIPGLIAGASEGKGLGHKFLRHVSRTKMLLHVISLENEDIQNTYYTIRNELSNYDKTLLDREEWIILSKKDLVNQDYITDSIKLFDKDKKRVFVISENDEESIKKVRDALTQHLQNEQKNHNL